MCQLSRNNGGIILLGPLGPVLASLGVLYLYCLYRYGGGGKHLSEYQKNNIDSTDGAMRSLQEVKVKQFHYRPGQAPRVLAG
jgi:hypothetical protein